MADSRVSAPQPTFACLWCGASWTVRTPDDLEGYARLCPDCLGKAGDNEFLRFRLRAALEARATAAGPAREVTEGATVLVEVAPRPTDTDPVAYDEARTREDDDWYLRRGRYAHGPIHDAAWNAELDAAGRWLDSLPFGGRLVELAAGTGWWSPLLASRGELWMYDATEAPLERARERLVAHRLRAHLHVRDAWAEPEPPPADALFAGFWLSHVERDRTTAFLDLAARWLAPAGRLALIDSLADPNSGAVDDPAPRGDRSVRRLDDGREFSIVKVDRSAGEIGGHLTAAGFHDVEVSVTGRFFVLATARRA